MTPLPRFYGLIKKGELVLDNPERYKLYLQANLEGKKVSLTIEKKFNKRSMNQNNLYWGYLGIIEEETGNMANDLHEYFKRVFLPPVFKEVLGKTFKIPSSTTDLSKGGMVEYLMKISSLTGVPIPDPAEWDFAPMKHDKKK